jgi:hypothetical protein
MNLHELLADIHALEEELLAFERKYGVRSETFYAAYMSGEEPEERPGCWISSNGASSTAPGWPGRRIPGMKSSVAKPGSLAWLVYSRPEIFS